LIAEHKTALRMWPSNVGLTTYDAKNLDTAFLPLGPFDQWPTGGGGFEYFYGFLGGETNQWYPAIYEGTTPMEQSKTPEQGYHFTEDMTNKTIGWVRQQKALMPDKPFFMYFAPGATHAPHQVPKEWTEKFKGMFDGGWDRVRQATFARQKKLGVIPAAAVLTKRPDEIPAYDDMPEALKPILAREMEVYAGFLAHTDHHLGRLFDTLQDLEVLDDTLIYYIFGENDASAEGGDRGPEVWRQRCHRRAWRRRRRLESVRPEWQVEALLQLLRHPAVLHREQPADSHWQTSGAHGVQVRWRRSRQGRRRLALRGRPEGRRRPRRDDRADAVLG
jgi:arylsulfatase A-like enzyme